MHGARGLNQTPCSQRVRPLCIAEQHVRCTGTRGAPGLTGRVAVSLWAFGRVKAGTQVRQDHRCVVKCVGTSSKEPIACVGTVTQMLECGSQCSLMPAQADSCRVC